MCLGDSESGESVREGKAHVTETVLVKRDRLYRLTHTHTHGHISSTNYPCE